MRVDKIRETERDTKKGRRQKSDRVQTHFPPSLKKERKNSFGSDCIFFLYKEVLKYLVAWTYFKGKLYSIENTKKERKKYTDLCDFFDLTT